MMTMIATIKTFLLRFYCFLLCIFYILSIYNLFFIVIMISFMVIFYDIFLYMLINSNKFSR